MKYIFYDYETFYSKDYSLRKMSPAEYILDDRFQVIGMALIEANSLEEARHAPAVFKDGLNTAAWIRWNDWKNTCAVAHNQLFDGCILYWRYGATPKLLVDTMGMARAWIHHASRSISLASCADYYGLPAKGNTILKVEGMGEAQIKAAGLWDDYVAYAQHDVELCRDIFFKMHDEGFPRREYIVNDTVLRCAIEPQFMADQEKLTTHLHNVRANKQILLTKATLLGNASKEDLMSDDKFAEVLKQNGETPHKTKISKVTGLPSWPFAKTDEYMQELQEHPDSTIQALACARLGLKTTLEETRTERLLNISRLKWPGTTANLGLARAGWMPVPLKYSGAHTHRLSGDWQMNLQNLPKHGELRKSLIAPPDHTVIAADLSQIEARLVGWFCGCERLLGVYRAKGDPYATFASVLYGREITKADKAERWLGKLAILGLGYGLGALRFDTIVKLQARLQGIELDKNAYADPKRVVDAYRGLYTQIPEMWKRLQNSFVALSQESGGTYKIEPVTLENKRIRLPNDLFLHYHNLKWQDELVNRWTFTYGGIPKILFGGKMLENIIQALARILVMDAALRIRKRLDPWKINMALQLHDELVYVIHTSQVGAVKAVIYEEMTRAPKWAPDLPLDAEVQTGHNYGELE